MNYNQTLSYIHSLGNFSKKASLERISLCLKKLQNPQNRTKAIHIAGTNGKGSVSAMLAEIFHTAGYKTGLYISPFIINFRERIQINKEFIPEQDLINFSQEVKDTNVELTEFEFITAVAFLYFFKQKCDIVIIETGLGGRLDATNTIKNPILNIITKIGLDHTAILGDDISKISNEKCGILKNCPLVTSYNQQKEVYDVIRKYKNLVYVPSFKDLKIVKTDETGSDIIYKRQEYHLSLCGDYQVENALIVIEAINILNLGIDYKDVYKSLSNTYFPARAEVISKEPLIVLDGAHNPDGAEALAKIMSHYSGNITAIVGVMKDKNYNQVLKTTLKYCKNVVVVSVSGMARSLEAEELYKVSSKLCRSYIADNYDTAIEKAIKLSCKNPIFIYGSLYLAAGIREILLNKIKKIK